MSTRSGQPWLGSKKLSSRIILELNQGQNFAMRFYIEDVYFKTVIFDFPFKSSNQVHDLCNFSNWENGCKKFRMEVFLFKRNTRERLADYEKKYLGPSWSPSRSPHTVDHKPTRPDHSAAAAVHSTAPPAAPRPHRDNRPDGRSNSHPASTADTSSSTLASPGSCTRSHPPARPADTPCTHSACHSSPGGSSGWQCHSQTSPGRSWDGG